MKYAWNIQGHRERLRALVLLGGALLVVSSIATLVVASTASASTDCEDMFNCFSLAHQFNASQPFESSAQFSLTTDISDYNLQSGERANCAGTNGDIFWGNNSAWYRFDAGVAGTLTVSATTTANGGSGFPIMLIQYEATHEDPIDYTSNPDLPSGQCSATGTTVHFDAPPQVPVHTNGPTFVQLLAYCGETSDGSNPCPTPLTTAGPVTLHFTFTPTDTDGDGVPDTLDQCPNVFAQTATGCPPPPPPTDTDGDGVPDVSDHCPTIAGPSKYNGCPDTDGDGIPDNLDACPNAAGPPDTAGCPDADGDGIPDRTDKCKTVFAVVGYSTIGDGRLGCPEPLATQFSYGYKAGSTSLTLTKFGVLGAPRGSRITVLCSGRGCPKRSLTASLTKKAGDVSVMGRLRSTGLRHGTTVEVPVGDRLTIDVSLRGTLGRTLTIVPRSNDQLPRITQACLSGKKVVRCPV
jgi:hypothetical protein